jgi:hypothetical protein
MKTKFIKLTVFIVFNLLLLTLGCVENIEDEEILTVIYEDYSINYNLNDLESMDSYTGTGGYIKSKLLPDSVVIENSNSYTGVKIITLLDDIPNMPKNYNLSIISSDGWMINFTKNEVMGYVDIYNEMGNIISNQTTVMIIAYKENGEYYTAIDEDNEIGPLRIAFVGNDVITSSNLWSRKVVSIHINKI